MDIEAREKLSKIIKEITESGEWTLDAAKLKSIKSICKRSDHNVESAFELWLAQLKKEHAQIRYSCAQLAEELFKRSHKFRSLLSDDFPLFISLTVGIHDKKLPPPAAVAAKLKIYTLALIKDWYLKFGDKYRPLVIGYDYLEHNGILGSYGEQSLDYIHAQDVGRAHRETRMQAIYERRFAEIKTQFQEQRELIEDNLKSMEGCFEILVPRNDENFIDFDALIKGDIASASQQRPEEYKESLMSHGLATNRYKITIDMSENPIMDQVQESEENEVLYEQLRESYKLLKTKHQNKVNEWINSLTRIEINDKKAKDALLKQLIDIKCEMDEATRKSDLLGIPAQIEKAQEQADDEFLDELFEEVEIPESSSLARKSKPSSNAAEEDKFSNRKLPPAQRIFPLAYEPAMEEDVTYNRTRVFYDPPPENDKSGNELSEDSKSLSITQREHEKNEGKGKEKQQGPSREELLKIAPVVEWGNDLFYWDKNSVQFNQSGIERAHRFMGVGEGTNEIPQHVLDNLRKRTMYYTPRRPQELKACRAPLHNGQLCPRRDLVTCPFHGKIIPRDEFGRPQEGSEESHKEEPITSTPMSSKNLWEELESDVMQQVGQERIDPNKRGRKRKQRSQSNLIDVRKKKETTMSRLQKKVDDPETRRLVQEAADYEQTMRARNKRANAW